VEGPTGEGHDHRRSQSRGVSLRRPSGHGVEDPRRGTELRVGRDTPEDLAKAEEYSARVLAIVGTEPHPGDYWKTATVAEAMLLKKDYTGAARLYKAAVAMARAEKGSQESTWAQACRLMRVLKPSDAERGEICFPRLAGLPVMRCCSGSQVELQSGRPAIEQSSSYHRTCMHDPGWPAPSSAED
jgi:hypothetical protein